MRRALIIGAVLLSTVGIIAGSLYGGMEGGDIWWPITWIAWAPVGGVILLRRPGNGVGVSLLVTGLFWGLGFLCLAIAQNGHTTGIGLWADFAGALLGVVSWLSIIWLILVFPSGTLEGRLERATAAGFMIFGALGLLAFAVSTVPMDATGVPSPLANERLSDAMSWLVGDNGFLVLIGLVALSIVSVGMRWHRSDGVERHQYRWLLLGALLFVATLALGQIVPDDDASLYMWLVAGAAIPVSVGVAVTRYRLYEIDRIISRTVTYGLVVAILAGVVAVLAAVAGSQFEEPWVVAATTLGVAAIFNPLRRNVQGWVERRFNRSRYDTERVMEDFTATLRDRVELTGVTDGWVAVVCETMEPASLGVWVKR